jgi:thymidylate synthase
MNEDKLVELADQKALDFLELKPEDKGFTQGQVALMKQAIFGYRIKQEVTKNKRSTIDQIIRAIKFLKPEEREEYIRASAPKLLPELKKRPK